MWRTATWLRSPLRLPGARRMCSTESTSEPARRSINDRLLDGAQKLVVTSLLLLTMSGVAFVLSGTYEIYDRNKQRKRLREEAFLKEEASKAA